MTLPSERINAIKNTRNFLRRLLDPSLTPRVPKVIRQEAYNCLKHYPWDMYIQEVMSDKHRVEEEKEALLVKIMNRTRKLEEDKTKRSNKR